MVLWTPGYSNKLRLDRVPTYTHWGRIDSRTGIDQRAEGTVLKQVMIRVATSHDPCLEKIKRNL